LPEYDEQPGRLDRRRALAARRASRRRKTAVALSAAVVILVVLGVAGWLVYQKVQAGHKPTARAYTAVFPEGLNNKEVAKRFGEETKGSINEAEFLAATRTGVYNYSFLAGANGNLEGFLFPNTYDVTSLTTAHQAVNMMLSDFHKETADLEWSRAAQLGVTPYQIVTVASIIEKEVKVPEERPMVASVIYNRLKKKMKLEMCSTVIYSLGQWKAKLSDQDLQVSSPYNTYKVDGLPPGPICNPGFESIRAALFPASTDYLFFILTNPDGHHSFTADYAQFLRWKGQQSK